MINNPPYNSELPEKILEGLRKAVRRLVERSAAINESLVIRDKDGKIKEVPAKDILEALEDKSNK